jgi:hypothetical protein
MISLRQHIFSLIAVFVALAIGIAAGSTVVRGPLLDNTRSRLETAEEQIATERAENDALAAEVAQLDDFAEDGPEQLLLDRLVGSSALLVVAGDVDSDVVRGVTESLEVSTSEYLGQIHLGAAVFDPEESSRIIEELGLDPETSAEDAMAAFGTRVAELIEGVHLALSAGGEGGSAIRGAFEDLEDAGLVDLLDIADSATGSDAFDLVVVSDRNVSHDPGTVLRAMVSSQSEDAAEDSSWVTMAVEVGRIAQGNDAPVDSFVESIRDDGRLRDEVSTVDNAETILGWIAMVLGLETAQLGEIGHYGFRDGAEQSIPPRP